MIFSGLKKCTTLYEVVEHIKQHHHIRATNGVHMWKMLRMPNGEKVPFEEQNGVQITDIAIHDDDTLVLEQHGFKQNKMFSSRTYTYLFDLMMINIYDHSAELCTNSGINLFYSEKTDDAKIVMLSAWIHDTPDIIRAQWFKDDEIEELLGFSDKKIQRTKYIPRSIDFEGDF